MPGGLKVHGYREFVRACNNAKDRDVKKVVREKLRAAGDIVRDEARSRFLPVDARSAAGFRTVVRVRGVAVEQRLPRTTGFHPEFGVLQMRTALLPAVEDKEPEIRRSFEDGLDYIADQFER